MGLSAPPPPPIMIVTNKSTSAYVYAILNISDLMFSPNHMCLLSVNAMTLPLTYFEIGIMPERLYDNKSTLDNRPLQLLKLKLLRPQCQIIKVNAKNCNKLAILKNNLAVYIKLV